MAAFPFLRRGERRLPTLLLPLSGLPSAFATAGATAGPQCAAGRASSGSAGSLSGLETSPSHFAAAGAGAAGARIAKRAEASGSRASQSAPLWIVRG